MKTALLIYLVMQLDSILGFLWLIAIASSIALVLMLFAITMFILDDDTDNELCRVISRQLKKIAPIALSSMVMIKPKTIESNAVSIKLAKLGKIGLVNGDALNCALINLGKQFAREASREEERIRKRRLLTQPKK